MAFENYTQNEWGQAFDANFLYAFILATFLLFNGLAFSDYIYYTSNNKVGFFINLEGDTFDIAYDICPDIIQQPIVKKETCISAIDDNLLTENEFNTSSSTTGSILENEVIHPTLYTKKETIYSDISYNKTNYTLTTTFPSQETISKNQSKQNARFNQVITSENYIDPEGAAVPLRSNNVRNTILFNPTFTSHTTFTTPQNKSFLKSVKNTSNDSKIDLEKLPEISFLLADLLETANLQGKNIILSFEAKWCLPCKQMEKNVYQNLEVNGTLYRDYVFKQLDEKDLEAITLKNLYDVKVYPTTLILDTNGNVVNRYEEGLSKNRMMNILAENTYRPTSDEVIVKVDSFSQPIELQAAINFLVSRAENSSLGFD